jgi:hypothetical protein
MYNNANINSVNQSKLRTADKDLKQTQELQPMRRANNYLSGFNQVLKAATKLAGASNKLSSSKTSTR